MRTVESGDSTEVEPNEADGKMTNRIRASITCAAPSRGFAAPKQSVCFRAVQLIGALFI